MLIKRNLKDCYNLFELMSHPDIFPYVRNQASSLDEYLFHTKQIIEAEERGEIISRTILDEWDNPIGTINLFDISNNCGFLGTWLGKPYHGKGYNKIAKESFFSELFFETEIKTVFMKVRQENIRSRKAVEKLQYTMNVTNKHGSIVQTINNNQLGYKYDLYEVSKDNYILYHLRQENETANENHLLNA